MKLPVKIYEPKHNKELNQYAIGWNTTITNVDFWNNKYVEEQIKKQLLKDKEFASKRAKRKEPIPFFKGRYDCIIEIEKLNEISRKEEKNKCLQMITKVRKN